MSKQYYVGHSYMGINYTYDSECWRVYAFDSKKARDEYLDNNEYDGSQYVAESITRKTAEKILGHSMDQAKVFEDNGYYKILTY